MAALDSGRTRQILAQVNEGRLWNDLMELAKVGSVGGQSGQGRQGGQGGQGGGGVTRLAFTPEDLEAKRLVARWLEEAGARVRFDAAGNVIARYLGTVADPVEPAGHADGAQIKGLPAVMAGSHTDTVPEGGRFDGAVGVIGALEALRVITSLPEKPRLPLEVVIFANEEGSRFGGGLFGSRALAGLWTPADLEARRDAKGLSQAEAMAAQGFDPSRIQEARREPGSVAAYLEMHIEQAGVLESLGLPVGLVSGIAGPVFLQLKLTGEANHAGATPMGLRRDALCAAAELVLAAERLAKGDAGGGGRGRDSGRVRTTVGTVGSLRVRPGAVNVIPGEVEMSFDLRDIDEAARDEAVLGVKAAIAEVCARRGIGWELKETHHQHPVPISPEMLGLLQEAASAAGVPVHQMPSGAAHDAMIMAGLTGAGMIFVRGLEGGVSHSPRELCSSSDIAAGTRVLLAALLRLAF